MEDENQFIVTITGADKIGIAAAVSSKLAEYNVNIKDIKQTLMENNFCMVMLCNTKNINASFKEFEDSIMNLSKKLSIEILIQKKG